MLCWRRSSGSVHTCLQKEAIITYGNGVERCALRGHRCGTNSICWARAVPISKNPGRPAAGTLAALCRTVVQCSSPAAVVQATDTSPGGVRASALASAGPRPTPRQHQSNLKSPLSASKLLALGAFSSNPAVPW